MADFPGPDDVGKISPIKELVGQTIDVADVVTMRDGSLAVITITGKTYLCDNEWASAGATFIQGSLNSSSADFLRVKIVEEQGKAGFRPADS